MKKQAYKTILQTKPIFFMVIAFMLMSFPPALQAGWADDVKQELLSQQSEPVADSDFELMYEEDGEDTDEGLPLLLGTRSHRPPSETAARVFYDRLVYIMGNLRNTEYVHSSGRVMNEDEGVYKYDCSGFVGDFILKKVLPEHYDDLVDNAAMFYDDSHPRAWGFYDYFKNILGDKAENSNNYWQVFKSYDKIQPGDIIVAKYDEGWRDDMIDLCGHASTGHVMVAWSFPVPSSVNDNEFWISIIDSSGSGHGKDTRRSTYDGVNDEDGIGKGKMWYGYNSKTTPQGVNYHRPIYYRWSKVDGCKYTLHSMSTNCEKDCCGEKHKNCISQCESTCEHFKYVLGPAYAGCMLTCEAESDCEQFCITDGEYYQRLQGIIMARPIN